MFSADRIGAMRRPLFVFLLVAVLWAGALAAGQVLTPIWYRLELQGQPIGYSVTYPEVVAGDLRRQTAKTVVDTQSLGQGLRIEAETVVTRRGDAIVELMNRTVSGGRTVTVTAKRDGERLQVTADEGGRVTRSTVELIPGLPFENDGAETMAMDPRVRAGTTVEFQSFDTSLRAMVRIRVVKQGAQTVTLDGRQMQVQTVLVDDKRAPSTIWLGADGAVLRIVGPMGMVLVPTDEAGALAALNGGGRTIDLAGSAAIRPTPGIRSPLTLLTLELRISGMADRTLPDDTHQSARKEGTDWILSVHPKSSASAARIGENTGSVQEWLKPESLVPSDSERFRELARTITGGETRVTAAAESLRRHVFEQMQVDAGIGVLRGADEILDTKEGVCRDHAILLATLLRAAGIPTRLVSGLVLFDGAFYYHAWVSYWDGTAWVGIDSTRPERWLTATHLMTAVGTVSDAYSSFLLDGAKITVIREGR